jgi:DNA repair protein RecO (recombination protein O)
MSEILKTEAFVLSKLNYGDTSSIVSLYTKDNGKISAIIKGARSPKSKMGMIIDPLNFLEIILYKKDSREVQLISSASLIDHYPKLKEDIDRVKYSYAVLELVKKLTPELEANERLFRGISRIFSIMDNSSDDASIIFGRFFMFFLETIGYEVQIENCAVCSKTNGINSDLSYNFQLGILCADCRKDYIESFQISGELLRYLICLKRNENPGKLLNFTADRAIVFMEKFLKYHVADFQGVQSFHIYK